MPIPPKTLHPGHANAGAAPRKASIPARISAVANSREPWVMQYGIGQSWMGDVLVGWSQESKQGPTGSPQEGVCCIWLADEGEAALSQIRRRWPSMLAYEASSPLLDRTIDIINGDRDDWSLPLLLRGTSFQISVWSMLAAIPRSRVVSYSDVARAIGRPSSVRAVAAAVGANPVSIILPCHRVIGQDGSLRGFYWGLELKQRLLRREGVKLVDALPEIDAQEGGLAAMCESA
jgi:AraC family transcriptional regulator, regulatory protein of adaptative response / methylated-DNA-[protein]-cysteine methyltransferase